MSSGDEIKDMGSSWLAALTSFSSRSGSEQTSMVMSAELVVLLAVRLVDAVLNLWTTSIALAIFSIASVSAVPSDVNDLL